MLNVLREYIFCSQHTHTHTHAQGNYELVNYLSLTEVIISQYIHI